MKTLHLLLLFVFSTPLSLIYAEKAPEIQDDYATSYAGITITINALQNDIGMEGHTIQIYHAIATKGDISYNDSMIFFTPNLYFKGTTYLEYIIQDIDNGLFSEKGFVVVEVENNSFANLDINNIDPQINGWGMHFYHPTSNNGHHFYAPAGSRKSSFYSLNLWAGGLDNNSEIHLAAEKYRLTGEDFFAGPIAAVYDSAYDVKWNRVWKISKSGIDYHKNNWMKSGYTADGSVLSWPAAINIGQAGDIAPYEDYNNDGYYTPLEGDYPIIKGDQAIFFILNDVREPHTESGGRKLGIEVHGMAYAFDCKDDSALYNTIFFNYKILNLSDTTYTDMHFGFYADLDLGDAVDDFITTDVQRNSIIGYNGDDFDGEYGINENKYYLDHPAAQSLTLLAGPYMDPDDNDNPRSDQYGNILCSEGILGTNFGDGIIDNERLGIGSSIIPKGSYGITSEPYTTEEYYNIMKGYWKNGDLLLYGGDGHTTSFAGSSQCRYMYPWNSDSLNWGTDCTYPNGGFNLNGYYWTEETAGNNPDDRRAIISTGPITFNPGDIQEIDLALVFARDYTTTGNHASVNLLTERIDIIKSYFANDSTPCGSSFSSINKVFDNMESISIYPIPASDQIRIARDDNTEPLEFMIHDAMGRMLISGTISEDNSTINVSKLDKGMYVISFTGSKSYDSKRFVKF